MDKSGDDKRHSDTSRAGEFDVLEDTADPADNRRIYPLHTRYSLAGACSNPSNLANEKYGASNQEKEKYYESNSENEKYFGSFHENEKYYASQPVNEKSFDSFHEHEKYFGFLQHETGPGDETEADKATLRQWLSRPQRIVNRFECLHIFAQVVEAVNKAHSRQVVLANIRPSCLVLSSFNGISLIDTENSFSSNPVSHSGKQLNNIYNGNLKGHMQPDHNRRTQTPIRDFQEYRTLRGPEASKQHAYYDGNLHRHASSTASASCSRGISMKRRLEAGDEMEIISTEIEHGKEESNREKYGPFQSRETLLMELSWYTSPEELMGESSSFSSNVYSLGVLLFELFCSFSSQEEQRRIMSHIRHRVSPPHLLRRWPKEIAFCLCLLHPEPNQRPKLSEVLQSEIMNEARVVLLEWKAVKKLEEEIADQELLRDFLIQVQQRKQETAEKLCEAVTCLTSDIEVVLNRQPIPSHKGISPLDISKEEKFTLKKGKKPSCLPPQPEQINGTHVIGRSSMLNAFSEKTGKASMLHKRFPQEYENDSINDGKKLGKSDLQSKTEVDFRGRSGRMLKDFKEIEKVYFSTRCMAKELASDSLGRNSNCSVGQGPVIKTGGRDVSLVNNLGGNAHPSGGSNRLGSFFDNLRKYLRFSGFKVKATLRQWDLLNSSSLVCSLSFDRDKEYFATAGVNKTIKVFECDTVVDEVPDIHYPVTEMISRSKLSSICWSSYIKNQIASSSFDGIVQLWDITKNQAVTDFEEHERRVWSVDFSQTDPRQLASGGDDGLVKLWNITQAGSVGTIRTNANVCCVQFPPDSPYLLALGSADYKIYCYDLRNTRKPWCFLTSHKRTVSYVKFLDSSNIVSASTDNTLKLWDLAISTGGALSNPVCTYTGHKNEKNFVGLSVADGYIATGSESNEVFVYHRSIPIPVACYKFSCVDAMDGDKIDDDTGQFVSSVCWRGQSQTLVAANSKGNIKILEMV